MEKIKKGDPDSVCVVWVLEIIQFLKGFISILFATFRILKWGII